MRGAPDFWWPSHATWPARALWPASILYGAVAAHRMLRGGASVGVPVLCVGNFTVGGAGKTPTALALADRLSAEGQSPAFLSRGYGRTAAAGVLAVDPRRHGAAEAGDEPLLLARKAPTFVAADRVAAAAKAVAAGASILILDDGFQSPSLAKTASVVVADGALGIGNGLCVPAGPLRAPMATQWRKTSLLCVVGPGAAGEHLAEAARRRAIPVAQARLVPDPVAAQALRGRRLFAFAGLGRPQKFFDTLEACGLDIVGRRAFPDHHRFEAGERQDLMRDARLSGADLVTTEKDRVRLPASFATHVLPVRLAFDDDEAIATLLGRVLEAFSQP